MKIAAYNYRDFDEKQFFDKFSKEYQVEIVPIKETPTAENARLAEGCDGVSVITSPITEEIMKVFSEVGVKHISKFILIFFRKWRKFAEIRNTKTS